MKKNLLPNMRRVKMTDSDGKEFVMEMDLRKDNNGLIYVFLSDTHQPGTSRLAQNAMHYIEQIVRRTKLDTKNAVFYRHIYQEESGSSFGRFEVDWENGPSYKFRMLHNLEDHQKIKELVESSVSVLQDKARKTA